MPSIDAAHDALAFAPYAPMWLEPAKVEITNPAYGDTPDRAIALIYEDAEGHPFYVMEHRARMTQADLESATSCVDEVGCDSSAFSLVRLTGGAIGLLTNGAGAAISVTWISDGIEFEVVGPKSTFGIVDALQVASLLPPASIADDIPS